MLSYEVLKLFHIWLAFVFISFAVLTLLAKPGKFVGALFGITSLGTAVVGFALIGALQSGLQHWMMGKFVLWIAIMAMIGIVNKRFPKFKQRAAGLLLVLVGLAIYLAVFKPY